MIRIHSWNICIFLLSIYVATSALNNKSVRHCRRHRSIDASHLYHCNITQITDSVVSDINSFYKEGMGMDSSDKLILDVDVSSSKLGDDGSIQLLTQVMNETKYMPRLTIRTFGLRMNGITNHGINRILKSLVTVQAQYNHPSKNMTVTEEGILNQALSLNQTQLYPDNKTEISDSSTNAVLIELLDLSFNNVGYGRGFAKALQEVFEVIEDENGKSKCACPIALRLDRCGLGVMACRAIYKGLIRRKLDEGRGRVRELYLSGNPDISDVGVATIVAALKDSTFSNATSFKILDISSCEIGDIGAESLSEIFSITPCAEHIDISNNKISDTGAIAIGRALSSCLNKNRKTILKSLNLSGNKGISDTGIQELARAIETRSISYLDVSSCSIRADGTAALGEAIKTLAVSSDRSQLDGTIIQVDISGNQLVLDSSKKSTFSAKAATESATIAFNFIGKRIKSGLKEYAGIDVTDIMGNGERTTIESDDEVESSMDIEGGESSFQSSRCGIRSFVDSIIGNNATNDDSSEEKYETLFNFKLGMRQCAVDQNAVNALAALVVYARKHLGIVFSIDLSMNNKVTPDIVEEFANFNGTSSSELKTCAERHFDVLKVLRDARERSFQATSISSFNGFENDEFNTPWGFDEEAYDVDEYNDDYSNIEYGDFENDAYDYAYDEHIYDKY